MGVQSTGFVDSGSQCARTQRQPTKNLKGKMKRETLFSKRAGSLFLELPAPLAAVPPNLQGCAVAAGLAESTLSTMFICRAEALPLNPCQGPSDNSHPTGADYRVQNEPLCHTIATAQLPYLPSDVTKVFCGQ